VKKSLSILLAVLLLFSLLACSVDNKLECPECGAKRTGNAVFCASCGSRFESLVICKNCRYENDAKNKFCAVCGSTLINSGSQGASKEVWLKTREIDPTGFTTAYFYDTNGYLLAERIAYTQTGNFYGILEYTNNSDGKPMRLQTTYARSNALGSYNSHYEWTYQYNTNGLLISSTSHTGTTTAYSYDSEGRLISKISGNSEIKYTYNDDGKLSFEINYSNGKIYQKQEYYYDANGNLSKKIVSSVSSIDNAGTPSPYSANCIVLNYEVPEYTVAPSPETTYYEEPESTAAPRPETTYYEEPESTAPTGPLYEYNYICDENGNIISMKETDLITGNSKTTTYEYIALSQFCQTGKAGQLPEEAGNFPSHIGRAGCDYCAGNGNDYCVGHICSPCNGEGYFTCRGCHGTGKGYTINGNNTCRVCYGSGKQICPNCDGAKKKFYN
jgi:YD repeat-containing protein